MIIDQIAATKLVRALLAHKADPNIARPRDGSTPLLIAVESGNLEVVKMLLEAGANPSVRDRYQSLPQLAVQHGRNDILELLASHGAELNRVDDMGWATVLTEAIRKKNIKAVEVLLKNGADPNQADGEGRTPLLIAREKDFRQIIPLLRKSGGHE